MQFLTRTYTKIQSFFILTALYLLFTLPLILSDTHYFDDYGRAAYGYKDFEHFKRFLNLITSEIIHTNYYLGDISPLPLLLSIVILSFSSIIIINLFEKSKENKIYLGLLLSISVSVFFPYFLNCLAFNYDCVYMSLAILLSVFCFIKDRGLDKLLYSFLGCTLALMSYQSSICVPILIIIYYFIYKLLNKGKLRTSILGIIPFIIGILFSLIFFKFFILRLSPVDPSLSYVSTELPKGLNNIFINYFSNVALYWKKVIFEFPKLWKVLLIIPLTLLLITFFKAKKLPILYYLIILFAITISYFLCFGFYPLLEKPLFAGRSMFGIGYLLALQLIVFFVFVRPNVILFSIPAIILWCFLSFSFLFGNILNTEKNYRNWRWDVAVMELNSLNKLNSDYKICLAGNYNFSPQNRNLMNIYPIAKDMLQGSSGHYWTNYIEFFYFRNMSDLQASYETCNNKDLTKSELIFSSSFSNIYLDNKNIIYQFK